MQEIVQLDGALTALLIPPGLCACAIPMIEPPPPHPEPKKEWSHVQELVFRWWTAVHRLRERLFSLFESVILSDLDYCNTAHVEQGMWKSVFYTVLELLRSWITNPGSTGSVMLSFPLYIVSHPLLYWIHGLNLSFHKGFI